MAWNGSDGVKAPEVEKKPPKGFKGAIAGVVIVVAALVAFFGVRSLKSEAPEREAKKANIPEVQPVKPAKVLDQTISKPKNMLPASKVESALGKLDEVERPKIKMRKLSEEEWFTLTNRTFKTGVEQLMSWVFSTTVGDMPMPIPSIGEEEKKNIVGILMSDNPITDLDDEKSKFCKENVMAAKKEMMKYLKEGGDPDEFLQYYFQELKYAFDKRNEARSQIQEAWEEDPEVGKEFLKRVNESFAEEGIKIINEVEVSE